MSPTNVLFSFLDCFLASWCTHKSRAAAVLFGALLIVTAACAADPSLYIEHRGLRTDDEFDATLRRAFGCPEETFKKMIADSNKRRSDGKTIRVPNCPVEATLKQIIERNSGKPSSAVDYIRSKGGNCSELGGGWHCVVTREVTSIGHAGNMIGGKLTDLFTIEISLSQAKEPIRVKLTRKGIGR